jgi:hypothetical protein
MTCKDYHHQISLFLYEELPEEQKPGLETHLQQCESCKLALEEQKGMHFVLAEDAASWDIPSDLLVESRRELANDLDQIEHKRSWWRLPTFSVVFTPMRLLESAALIAMGLALGVYVTNQQQVNRQNAAVPAAPESAIMSSIPANGSVSNLRIVSANPVTGQVELAGEIVQPLRMQGTMGDDTVRQLLVSALGDVNNSGSRLRAVEVLSQRPNDDTIKGALIQALMYDDNPGVRLRAMQGLKQFSAQDDVRAAFMHTLGNDNDAGIRVEAIEALTRGGHDLNLVKALEPFTRDDNTYVKMKALQFVGNNR